jgi:hypothetical protein
MKMRPTKDERRLNAWEAWERSGPLRYILGMGLSWALVTLALLHVLRWAFGVGDTEPWAGSNKREYLLIEAVLFVAMGVLAFGPSMWFYNRWYHGRLRRHMGRNDG